MFWEIAVNPVRLEELRGKFWGKILRVQSGIRLRVCWMQVPNLIANERQARRLSRELREDSGGFLESRRAIVGLSLFSAGLMGLIALYQIGIIRRVPDPPLPGFDSDRVNGSGEAYKILQTPDGILGLGSYAVTAGLAAMGGTERVREQPWIPLALAGKALLDLINAGRLTWQELARQRALCFCCLLATAATIAAVPLSWPEAREAFSSLRKMPVRKTRSLFRHRKEWI